MTTLAELESKLQNYLMHQQDDIKQHVVSTTQVSADVRLDIYRHAYEIRLIEALETSYPILKKFLGSAAFAEIAAEYIAKQPSAYRSIRWYGDNFADFLRRHARCKKFQYLAELALLEWTMGLVFDAADCAIFPAAEMVNIPPEAWVDMRFETHPSLYRLNLHWNVVKIWQAMTDDKDPPEPERNPSAQAWLLWRKELICQFASLTADETWAVDAMLQKVTFGEICAGICQWLSEDEAGLRAASLLKGWIMGGLITQVLVQNCSKL